MMERTQQQGQQEDDKTALPSLLRARVLLRGDDTVRYLREMEEYNLKKSLPQEERVKTAEDSVQPSPQSMAQPPRSENGAAATIAAVRRSCLPIRPTTDNSKESEKTTNMLTPRGHSTASPSCAESVDFTESANKNKADEVSQLDTNDCKVVSITLPNTGPLGLVLLNRGASAVIDEVVPQSQAEKYGVLAGDVPIYNKSLPADGGVCYISYETFLQRAKNIRPFVFTVLRHTNAAELHNEKSLQESETKQDDLSKEIAVQQKDAIEESNKSEPVSVPQEPTASKEAIAQAPPLDTAAIDAAVEACKNINAADITSPAPTNEPGVDTTTSGSTNQPSINEAVAPSCELTDATPAKKPQVSKAVVEKKRCVSAAGYAKSYKLLASSLADSGQAKEAVAAWEKAEVLTLRSYGIDHPRASDPNTGGMSAQELLVAAAEDTAAVIETAADTDINMQHGLTHPQSIKATPAKKPQVSKAVEKKRDASTKRTISNLRRSKKRAKSQASSMLEGLGESASGGFDV